MQSMGVRAKILQGPTIMSIKQQQTQILSSIFSFDQLQKKKMHNDSAKNKLHHSTAGLAVYQQSLLANASRALAITFATVHSFIGEVSFTLLAKEYLQASLKDQYDWGELGNTLPAFIKQQGRENNEVLATIAELDFTCHQSERAQDIEQDLTTLSLLSDVEAYQLSINFSAGFRVLKLKYPADLIIEKVKVAAENNDKLSLNDIRLMLADIEAGEYHYLIWRPSFQAQYQQITPQEYQWLALWQSPLLQPSSQQLSIGLALDKVTNKDFSIVDWLPKAIGQQLINSISSIETTI